MLALSPSEVSIVKGWTEKAQGSPFPHEQKLLRRIKSVRTGHGLQVSGKELEIIQHWAELDTRGHYGTERYLLAPEADLLQKIDQYLADI